MTTCECCGRHLRQGDTIHGLRYGTLTGAGFQAAKDSAVTVICGDCGNLLCNMVYASLDQNKLPYPRIFNMVNELTVLMKNGYKLIQIIATLPAPTQKALQHLIIACKETR